MKMFFKNILSGVVAATLASSLWSCSAESPFDNDEDTGTVYLHTIVSNLTTRAIDGYTDQQLSDKCVVYITRLNGDAATAENPDGLVYRKVGLDNVDSNIILKAGHYVAEAWTGDSVPASYNCKFFRGYTPFDVSKGSITSVNLPCKIQNVIVSFNPQSSALSYMNDDYTITVHNDTVDLVLDKNHLKGYFMVPDDPNADESLTFTVAGSRKEDNRAFTAQGNISDVKRAWEYTIQLDYAPPATDLGGASFFEITIDEGQVGGENETPLKPTDPVISGVGFDLKDQWDFSNTDNIPDDLGVMICSVGKGLNDLEVSFGSTSFNLLTPESDWTEAGIVWIAPEFVSSTNVSTAFLLFKKSFFLNLSPDSDHEISIMAKDPSGKSTTTSLKIKR